RSTHSVSRRTSRPINTGSPRATPCWMSRRARTNCGSSSRTRNRTRTFVSRPTISRTSAGELLHRQRLLTLPAQTTCHTHDALVLDPEQYRAVRHYREGHPIARLHLQALADLARDGGLAFARQCRFGAHGNSICTPYETYCSKE